MKPVSTLKVFTLALAAFAPALAGCTASATPPSHIAHAAAADPRARTPKARYAPVLAGYEHHVPVEAADWRELNRRVAPPGSLPGSSPPAAREGAR